MSASSTLSMQPQKKIFSNAIHCVAYNGSVWVAGGDDGIGSPIKYSVDCSTWLDATIPGLSVVYDVKWNGLQFLAGGQLSDFSSPAVAAVVSANGSSWTSWSQVSADNNLHVCRCLQWDGRNWFLGGYNQSESQQTGRLIYRGMQDTNWASIDLSFSGQYEVTDVKAIASNGSILVVLPVISNYTFIPMAYLSDISSGLKLGTLGARDGGELPVSVCCGRGVFLASTSLLAPSSSDTSGYYSIYHSTDGKVWNRYIRSTECTTVCYTGTNFVAFSTSLNQTPMLTSDDGLVWYAASRPQSLACLETNTLQANAIVIAPAQTIVYNDMTGGNQYKITYDYGIECTAEPSFMAGIQAQKPPYKRPLIHNGAVWMTVNFDRFFPMSITGTEYMAYGAFVSRDLKTWVRLPFPGDITVLTCAWGRGMWMFGVYIASGGFSSLRFFFNPTEDAQDFSKTTDIYRRTIGTNTTRYMNSIYYQSVDRWIYTANERVYNTSVPTQYTFNEFDQQVLAVLTVPTTYVFTGLYCISTYVYATTKKLSDNSAFETYRSSDGTTWVSVTNSSSQKLYLQATIKWNGSMGLSTIAGTSGGSIVVITTDGINWTNGYICGQTIVDIEWNGALWLIATSSTLMESADGVSCSAIPVPAQAVITGVASSIQRAFTMPTLAVNSLSGIDVVAGNPFTQGEFRRFSLSALLKPQ